MNWDVVLPLLVLSTPLTTAIAIFLVGEEHYWLRTWLNIGGAFISLVLILAMAAGVYLGVIYEARLELLPGLDLVLWADPFTMLFAILSAVLWLLTTMYAVGYLEMEGSLHRSRFFGFFSLCVAATKGVAMSGNLFTFFIFYELLTLSTYPLVVHRGNDESLRAGGSYLRYTLTGSAAVLLGIIWLNSIVGASYDFDETGILETLGEEYQWTLRVIFFLLVGGFGVKAALIPTHSWLPLAMAAPAPVSALLHAVAVVKAGAFGIVRVVYDVYGVAFASALSVTQVLAVLAAATIIYGSLRALSQDDLKRRLAYSTVSQVSYIVLGAAIAGPIATIGGIVHLVHQGLMKITLFFCAGILEKVLHIKKVSQMDGAGQRMPWTMAAFTIGALGMMGIPPMAGFISKWYLGRGALEVGQSWVIAVLVASTLLNAAYFLPTVYRAWFRPPPPDEHPEDLSESKRDIFIFFLSPALVTAILVLASGLLANAPYSPLDWAYRLAEQEYR